MTTNEVLVSNGIHLRKSPDNNETGTLLSAMIGLALAILGVVPFYLESGLTEFKEGRATLVFGLYLIVWAALVLISVFHFRRAVILRAIFWLATHIIVPRGRWNAYLISAVLFFFGAYLALIGAGIVAY